MKLIRLICVVILMTLAALLLGSSRLAEAQGENPPEGEEVMGVIEPQAVIAPGAIGIQGRLTDAGGNPLTGTYSIVFSLYEVDTGGTAICSDTNSVTVTNGLFNSYVDNCYTDVTGQKVWLGIKVGSDAEMTPRQVILPVAYALSLVPGANITGTVDGILTLENNTTNTGDYDTLSVYGASTGEAITADADDGFGVAAYSDTNTSIFGYSFNTENHPAILGCVADVAGTCDPKLASNPAGLFGFSTEGDGVQGQTTDLFSRGVFGYHTGGGVALGGYSNSADTTNHWYPTLSLVQANSSGDFVVGYSSVQGTRYWRVDRGGNGYFNSINYAGADFAEQIEVTGDEADYEPGDVMVISTQADRVVELSTSAYSTAVLGVYSTDPAAVAGAPDTDDLLGGVPVAIVGIVPCKVSAENGPIQRGDLLVTSSRPGYAMRAGPNPPQGTVLGKAMQPLESGTGVITILVTLQ